jgi:hypothetical protein
LLTVNSAVANLAMGILNAALNTLTMTVAGVATYSYLSWVVKVAGAWVAEAEAVGGKLIELIRHLGGHHGNH